MGEKKTDETKKPTNDQLLPAPEAAMVTVVCQQAIAHGGLYHAKGATVQLPADVVVAHGAAVKRV